MKNVVLFACLLVMSCAGCSKQEKGCMTVQPQDEVPQILAFAAADSLTLTKDSSGLYYQIINPGAGAKPDQKDTVLVTYTGKLLNGTTFDQENSPVQAVLDNVIEGWQIGIPLIKKGGRIKLVIPSAYAYGCNGKYPIPSNAVLFFDVTLTDIR